MRQAFICGTRTFKVGDPAPSGYLEWHEWANVQHKGGLRQLRRRCGFWHFPQEVCEHEERQP